MEKYEPLSVFYKNQVKEVHFDSLSVNVSAGSKGTCQIIVPRPNTVLSWSFLSQYYDIDFSVTAGEDGKETEIIVPPLRYSADVEHQGKIVVPKIGTYYLVWDNTSSWMRKRNVVYSYSLHFLDLDLDEKTLCSKTVLNDLRSLEYSVYEMDQLVEEKNSELTALKTVSNQRIAKRELISNELGVLRDSEAKCSTCIDECNDQIAKHKSHIEYLHSMAAFLVEDDRIFSFLDSVDMLRLANVNKYLNDATHQDSVWKRLFKTDSEENLSVAVKNEWLLQKWRLFNNNVPVPK